MGVISPSVTAFRSPARPAGCQRSQAKGYYYRLGHWSPRNRRESLLARAASEPEDSRRVAQEFGSPYGREKVEAGSARSLLPVGSRLPKSLWQLGKDRQAGSERRRNTAGLPGQLSSLDWCRERGGGGCMERPLPGLSLCQTCPSKMCPTQPPSSSTGGNGFPKKHPGYHWLRQSYCTLQPIPNNCNKQGMCTGP